MSPHLRAWLSSLLTLTCLGALLASAASDAASALASDTVAQAPHEIWNRTFGGARGDGAWCLDATDDGGCILVGNTASMGEGSDLFLIRTDADGNSKWNRTLGGSGEDVGYFVQETHNGGFIVTGSTASYSMGNELLWLLRLDQNGSLLWDRTFGGFVSSSGDGGWSVQETDDGGFIATGYTQSEGSGGKDLWLIRTDSNGSLIWDRAFGGREDDVGMSVLESSDGCFVVAGRSASFGRGEDDMWLLKTDSNGSELWNSTFGGAGDDAAFQVVELEDGYALAGRTQSGQDGQRIRLIRVDLRGGRIWEKTYQGSSGASIQATGDGGFIIAGRIDDELTGRDALLIGTDSTGREKWSLRAGGSQDDIGTFVSCAADGGYLMAGITSSFGMGREDAWLVRIEGEESTDQEEGYALPVRSDSSEGQETERWPERRSERKPERTLSFKN